MNPKDEKERNVTVEKIIGILGQLGKQMTPRTLSEFLEKEKDLSGAKSEDDYQKEQSEWLEKIKRKKKSGI